MNLVTVVAVLKAKPGQEHALQEALLGLVEPTRAESGCLQYDLHVSTENPGEFVFVEKWMSKEALDEHLQKPHSVALRARGEELFGAPPEIKTYSRLA